jgi:hypothetical protein
VASRPGDLIVDDVRIWDYPAVRISPRRLSPGIHCWVDSRVYAEGQAGARGYSFGRDGAKELRDEIARFRPPTRRRGAVAVLYPASL